MAVAVVAMLAVSKGSNFPREADHAADGADWRQKRGLARVRASGARRRLRRGQARRLWLHDSSSAQK